MRGRKREREEEQIQTQRAARSVLGIGRVLQNYHQGHYRTLQKSHRGNFPSAYGVSLGISARSVREAKKRLGQARQKLKKDKKTDHTRDARVGISNHGWRNGRSSIV